MYIVQMIDGLVLGGAQQLQITFAREAKRRGFKLAVISLSEDDGSPYPDELRSLGATVHFFPTTRIFNFENISKITQWFRSEQPDIIHTHLTYSNIIGAFVGVLTGTPVVTTLHSIGVEEKFRAPRTEYVEMVALRYLVSKIIACGPAVAKHFKPKIGRKPILVIPNAVDYSDNQISPAKRDTLRKEVSGGIDRFLVISVGRLTTPKGFDDLIDAFAILHQSHPSVFMAIAGNGDLYDMLIKKIIDLSLSDHVKLLGRRTDVPDLLLASDMYVLASRWEGLPIAILEAMAAGLPVLATDVGDNAWALGPAGITVPSQQPELFASAMMSLLDDTVRCKELGQAARARIEEKFNPSVWFENILSVYNSLLNKNRKRLGTL